MGAEVADVAGASRVSGVAAEPASGPASDERRSTASLVTERILRGERSRFIRAAEFAGPAGAVERTLARLVERGELVRVRNGLYYRGVETPLGMAPPDPREVIAALAPGRAIGPAGVTAANMLGLTTQVARRPAFAVTAWDGRPLEDVRILRRGGARGRGREAARLRGTEVALLEVLDAWADVVELRADAALERISTVLRSGEVRRSALLAAGPTEPARVRERLRFILAREAGDGDDVALLPPASRAEITEHALAPMLPAGGASLVGA